MFVDVKPILKKVFLIFLALVLLVLAVSWLFPEIGATLRAKQLLQFWQEYEPSEKTWICITLNGQPLMNLSKEKNPEIWEALREVTFDKPQKLPLNVHYDEGLTAEDQSLWITICDPETQCGTNIFLTKTERACRLEGASDTPDAYLKNTTKLYRAAGEAYAKQFGEDYNEKYYAFDWQQNMTIYLRTREGGCVKVSDETRQKDLVTLLQGLRYEMTLDDFLAGVPEVKKATFETFDYTLEIYYPGENRVWMYGINAGEGSVYLSREVDHHRGINGKLRLEHGADLYPFLSQILPRGAN